MKSKLIGWWPNPRCLDFLAWAVVISVSSLRLPSDIASIFFELFYLEYLQ